MTESAESGVDLDRGGILAFLSKRLNKLFCSLTAHPFFLFSFNPDRLYQVRSPRHS